MGRLGRRPIVDVEHRAHQAIVDDQVEELDRQALERGLPLRRLPPETKKTGNEGGLSEIRSGGTTAEVNS
jgi:hypothetical protein